VIEETVYLGDTPIAVIKAGQNYYVYADHLNTPRVITNTNNTPAWRWDSEPFGAMWRMSIRRGWERFSYNLRFPGQYYDQETGLNYNGFRDYDSSTGRYIQSDPIGLYGGTFSTYGYVGGNPVRYSDPSGLCGPLCAAEVGGAATGSGAVATGGAASWNGQQSSPSGSQPFWPKWVRDLFPSLDPDYQWVSEDGSGATSASKSPAYQCKPKSCTECSPPKGTICYSEQHTTHTHYPYEDHYHIFVMTQDEECACRWKPLKKGLGHKGAIDAPPPGAIPCPFTR
jgi:RHS repeat-associated protein